MKIITEKDKIDVYIQITNVLKLDISDKEKADLLKKLFDSVVEDMVQLIYKGER